MLLHLLSSGHGIQYMHRPTHPNSAVRLIPHEWTYVRINNCTVPHPSISKGSGGVIYRQALGV